MKTLIIDTHLNDIIIILLENGKIANKKEVINQKNNSEILMSTIISVINGIKLEEIIVVNGPGSFTSVRLGVTIAKTLAFTLNIHIKTITSLEVTAISNESLNVAIGDNNGFYVGEFNANYIPQKDFIYVDNSTFTNINKNNRYITNYKIDGEKVYNFLKNREYTNPHQVNPIYIKKIGVEIDKKSSN